MPIIDQPDIRTILWFSSFTRFDAAGNVTESSSGYLPQGALVAKFYKSWSRTPNFRALVKAKSRLPDLPFVWERRWQKVGGFDLYNRSAFFPRDETFWQWPGDLVSWVEASTDIQRIEIYSKLLERARGQSAQLPVSILEGRKTAQMIFQTASRLALSFRQLRRGRFFEAAGTLGVSATTAGFRRYRQAYGRNPAQAAANQWLQWKYGWMPLLKDVYDTASTFASIRDKEWAQRFRVRARIQRNRPAKGIHVIMVSPNVTSTISGQIEDTMRGVWEYKPNSWAPFAQLGLLNPLSVAWELVPFSFVVDWFIPLGDYFAQIDTPLWCSHVGGSIGSRIRVKARLASPQSSFFNECYGSVDTDYVTLSRMPLTEAPLVNITDLRFDPHLGWQRVTSGIALLTQAFGRRK